jgi:hypothetical protein
MTSRMLGVETRAGVLSVRRANRELDDISDRAGVVRRVVTVGSRKGERRDGVEYQQHCSWPKRPALQPVV